MNGLVFIALGIVIALLYVQSQTNARRDRWLSRPPVQLPPQIYVVRDPFPRPPPPPPPPSNM